MVISGRIGRERYSLKRSDGRLFARFTAVLIFLACFALFTFETYATADDKTGPPGEASDEIILSLQDAINIAMKANRSLISSGYRLERGELSLESAKSNFDIKAYPNATAGVSGSGSSSIEKYGLGLSFEKKFSAGSFITVRPSASQLANSYSGAVGISLTQPLFRGQGKETNLNGVYGAKYSLRTSKKSYYLSSVNVVLRAVAAFYNVARQEETLKLDKALADKLKGHAQAARAKQKVGFASPIDVYRAEIQLQNAENSVAEMVEASENAKDNLRTVLALSQNTPIAVKAFLKFDDISISEKEASRLAIRNRVELMQAQNDIDEAKRISRLAKHNILPDMDVVLDYSRFSDKNDLSQIGGLDQNQWAVRLVTKSDFARTAERLWYRKSLFNIETAKIKLETVKDDVRKQVSAQLRALKKAKELIKNRKEQIVQAGGKLEIAQVKFNYGMANNFDLIEAEIELQRAYTNKLFATINYITGTFKLRAALGTLVDHDIIN